MSIPDNRHFGFAYNQEMRAIEARLRALGITEQEQLIFAAQRAYEAAHRNDPSMKERQAAWLARCRADQPAGATVFLTQAELSFLAEHFAGANDPVVLAILAKIVPRLNCV